MKIKESKNGSLLFRCPGCKRTHILNIPSGTARWTWNNDVDKPTFRPSVHTVGTWDDGTKVSICHCWVTEGKIEFLMDCDHELKGQTVELPEYYKEDEV